MKNTLLFTILIATCLFSALPSDAGKAPSELLIIYSGQTLGELKPCGCSREEDQGGIERRMSYLKEAKADRKNVLLVDVGDNFKDPTPQGKIKAKYLMRSMDLMRYDAITLGDKDFVYGNHFIQDMDLPWVSSNITLKHKNGLPKVRFKQFDNGLKVAIIAVSDPKLFYLTEHADIKMEAPGKAINSLLPDLLRSEKPDAVILLSHMRRDDALKLMDIDGIDVFINGHIETENDTIDMAPVRKGDKIFLQPGPRGQKMGELKITIDSQARKTYEQRMVKMDSSVKDDGEMVKLYNEYDEEIEALFIASLAAKKTSADNRKVYATDTVCMACHTEIHGIWSRSRHAKAYSTLIRVNKAFDPECLVCHTTGFSKPGGFTSEVDTPELKNVQCEICHGPGLKHAQSPEPGFGRQAKEACKQCHVKSHSPQFNYRDYWPRIKH